ncbi:MAG: hypothetical protein AAGF30_00335 [Pseudomonadota bacterium]
MAPDMVRAYLRDTAALPWQWGVVDCMMWAASLVERVTGEDPAADLRGRYADSHSARTIETSAGGALILVTTRLDGILVQDDDAGWGICVSPHDRWGACCGIVADGRAMLKTDRGLTIDQARPFAVWRAADG